jgi:ribosome maturation factor RimP
VELSPHKIRNAIMENTFKTDIADSLQKPATKLASARGLHLLRINVRGSASTPVIEVLLDGERLVTIEDCADVSKELDAMIESEKLVKGNYRLDVMSPGIDEPLVENWQFQRNLGRLVEAHYQDAGEHHTLHGHLRSYTASEIGIEPIHIHSHKPAKPKTVTTEDGPIALKRDEQLYDDPVALVKIERKHLTKVTVQPDFRK